MNTQWMVPVLCGAVACTDNVSYDFDTAVTDDVSSGPNDNDDGGPEPQPDTGEADTGSDEPLDSGELDTGDDSAGSLNPAWGHWMWTMGELLNDSCGLEDLDVDLGGDEGVTLGRGVGHEVDPGEERVGEKSST